MINLNLADTPQLSNSVMRSAALNLVTLQHISISCNLRVDETGLRSLTLLKHMKRINYADCYRIDDDRALLMLSGRFPGLKVYISPDDFISYINK